MRVLFVNHRDPHHPRAGGSEQVLLEAGKRLAARGHEVTIVSEAVPGRPREEYLDGVLVRRAGNTFTLHLNHFRYLGEQDVVADSVAHAVPFLSFLRHRNAVALLHHVHQDVLALEVVEPLAWALRRAERIVKFYPRVIAVSETTRAESVRRLGVRPERITVIRNGVDHGKFRPGERSPRPTFLWIWRLKRYKNPLDALRAFREVRGDASLLIAGDGGPQGGGGGGLQGRPTGEVPGQGVGGGEDEALPVLLGCPLHLLRGGVGDDSHRGQRMRDPRPGLRDRRDPRARQGRGERPPGEVRRRQGARLANAAGAGRALLGLPLGGELQGVAQVRLGPDRLRIRGLPGVHAQEVKV